MDNDFMMTMDDVQAVLSKESEVILTELAKTDCLVDGDDKHEALTDAMCIADRYAKLFEAATKFEQQRADTKYKEQELELRSQELEIKRTELDKRDEELDIKRSELELKSNELDERVKENSENAIQAKRAARTDTAKFIGDIVLKCGLLFAQGMLYTWGVKQTFDFEKYNAASTSIGKSLLNNVTSLFIKK